MTIDHTDYQFIFGAGKWIGGETTKPGPDLFRSARSHLAGLPPNRVLGFYCWKDANTVELGLHYIESPHTEKITCRIEQNNILVDIWQSNTPSKMRMVLKGEISHSISKNTLKTAKIGEN